MRKKRPISQEFHENFQGKFSPKNKEESPEERFQKKKDILKGMSNSGQERKHKSSSNTVLQAIVLVSSYKKNVSFTETPGRLTSFLSFELQFRAKHSNAKKFLFSPWSLVLLCSLQDKIVRDRRFKSICEVKTLLYCLRLCPARTIKHVPALLQTAVSFPTPYSVTKKSSHFLCPVFPNINLRTPGSYGMLCFKPLAVTRFQDKFAFMESKQPQ